MLEANRLVLEDLERAVEGELIDSKVEGRVVIAAGARARALEVRGPAIIGAGARIVDAYIGPYTAIDADVTIERSEVEHSILLAGARSPTSSPHGGEPARPQRQARRAATGMPRTLG